MKFDLHREPWQPAYAELVRASVRQRSNRVYYPNNGRSEVVAIVTDAVTMHFRFKGVHDMYEIDRAITKYMRLVNKMYKAQTYHFGIFR